MRIYFIYVTFGSLKEARRIGGQLVKNKLAACTNIIVLENGKISIGGPAQKVLAHLRNPENETKKSIAKQNNKNERGDSLQ